MALVTKAACDLHWSLDGQVDNFISDLGANTVGWIYLISFLSRSKKLGVVIWCYLNNIELNWIMNIKNRDEGETAAGVEWMETSVSVWSVTLRIATRVNEQVYKTEVWFEDKKTRGGDVGGNVVNTLHLLNISILALLQWVCSYIDVSI